MVRVRADHLAATRAAYDTVAEDYARLLAGALDRAPWDRAVLATFAELVLVGGPGVVADVGCGPGRITGHLHGLGLDVLGVDLSPQMLAVARRALPGLTFVEGSMTALDLGDASLRGLVAWYSLIHVPPPEVPAVLAGFARVLAPGGRLLLAFQVGDERRRLEHAYGHAVALDAYRMLPERLAGQLEQAGLPVTARVVREPEPPETVPQAYLLARRTG